MRPEPLPRAAGPDVQQAKVRRKRPPLPPAVHERNGPDDARLTSTESAILRLQQSAGNAATADVIAGRRPAPGPGSARSPVPALPTVARGAFCPGLEMEVASDAAVPEKAMPGRDRAVQREPHAVESPTPVTDPGPAAPARQPLDAPTLLRLQATAGNAAVSTLLAGPRPAPPGQHADSRRLLRADKTIMFDDPDVITVPTHTVPKSAEGSGVKEINQIVDDQATNLRSTQLALLTGIDNFSEYQKFASSKEAKADYAGVVMKFATKQIIGEAVKAIDKSLPGFEKIYKVTFGLVEELEKEHGRALKARREVDARDFIVQYRQLVTDVFNDRIGQVPAVREGLQEEYAGLALPPSPPKKGEPAPPTGWVVGDQAAFLTGLRKAISSYKVPNADQCLKVFTEAWVMQAEDQVKSRGGGDMYADGRINLAVGIDKDGNDYTISSWPQKGALASPRADKTIDALARVFQSGVAKNTNELEILKVLKIDVEDEVFGFNDHYHVTIKFRHPDSAEYVGTVPSPVNGDTVPRADGIGRRAAEMVLAQPGKLGVTQLSPVAEGWLIAGGPKPAPKEPPVPAPGPTGPAPADDARRQEAKAAVRATLGAHYPEMVAIIERLIDDKDHHLNLVESLMDPAKRAKVLGILAELCAGQALAGKTLEEFIREHPGHGPLFEKIPPDVNFDKHGRSRKNVFLEGAKETDPARKVGAKPTEEQRQLVEEYAKRLKTEVEPEVFKEVGALTKAVDGEFGAGSSSFNVRTKDAAAILDKVKRMAEGREGQKPKPDAQVGDMVDAVGARITVQDTDQLGRLLKLVQAHYGTGDKGRIIELENLYLNPKAKNFAYRVIPLTIVIAPKGDDGLSYTYELQLTTLMASVAADLEHNVVYKDTIGATPEEKRRVKAAQAEAAAIEQLETRGGK
jgi:ppGpp synthetase/RelA/SpoT-type nucleotidyltranferase